MASFIIKVLSVTLGLFFIFVGLLKLSPVVNKELYKEMVGSKSYAFIRYCTSGRRHQRSDFSIQIRPDFIKTKSIK